MLNQNYSNVLITGGAGFVGSNLAVAFKNKYPSLEVICLDNLKRRGSEISLKRLNTDGIAFIHGDIRNPEDLDLALNKKIDLLIECSAEPSVMAGYGENPAYLINTNLMGTINCLNMAVNHRSDVIFLSTSRVYPTNAINALDVVETDTRFDWIVEQKKPITGWSADGIAEDFSLTGPKSLYGATKLCSELILQEYAAMYGLRSVINRCGVIAGPWQFGKVDQGVCTFWMLSHYFKKNLRYIGFGGEGKQVRDFLHINDLFELIEKQIESFEETHGNVYNVGGGRENSISLKELSRLCEQITSREVKIYSEKKTRPNDVMIYITNNSRIFEQLQWKPKRTIPMILEDIHDWIKVNEQDISKSFFSG